MPEPDKSSNLRNHHPTLVPHLLGLGNDDGYDMASAWDDMVVATLHNLTGDYVAVYEISQMGQVDSLGSVTASEPRVWKLPPQVSTCKVHRDMKS
jgi:hypothetical protein